MTLSKTIQNVKVSKSKQPIMVLLDLLSRRWALRILWELQTGPHTFRPLQKYCGGISPSVLNKRLAEMREANIVELHKGQGYSITREGIRLCDALLRLNDWANQMSKNENTNFDVNESHVKFCSYCSTHLISKMIEDKHYLTCPNTSCNYTFWDNPVPVVAAIVEHNGSILLARNKAWPEKIFGLITGFLEKGETPEDAIIREVKEELKLETLSVEYIGIYSFIEMNQMIIGYHVSTDGEICLGDELAEIKSIRPEKIRPWPFGTGFIVQQWLEGRGNKIH